jgi:hypothetical protein
MKDFKLEEYKPKEKDIQTAILGYVRSLGIVAWKSNTTGIWVAKRNTYIKSAMRGVADLLGVIPGTGRFLSIEVKRPSGKQEEEQIHFEELIKGANGIYILAHSVEEVEAKFKELKIIDDKGMLIKSE